MTYEGKIISGDGHLDLPWLPADLFQSNAPSHLKDRLPVVRETNDGEQWFADDRPLSVWVAGAGSGLKGYWDPYVPGHSTRLDRMEEQGFFSDGLKGLFHPSTPELRIRDQEIDGISGEVLYGVLGMAADDDGSEAEEDAEEALSRPFVSGLTDPEAITAVYDIYNEWVADLCRVHSERLVALACLSAHNPQVAARQLYRAAEMGLGGGEMNVNSAHQPIYHRDWDVLWAAAAETGLPVSFHTAGILPKALDDSDMPAYRTVYQSVSRNIFQLSGAELLAGIIFSGACTRYPTFKFVLGECGIGWIPYMLHRMDEQYEKEYFELDLGLKPSELWRRQGYSTFQHEFVTDEMVSFIGEDNIMWGSDYPHPDCVWPDSRQVINENLGNLDERALKKIVCDNTARLYGFPR